MALYKTIEEYNTYLVENQVNINIIDYVKEVNKLEFNIDISFIDEFTGEALQGPVGRLN